VPRCGQGVGSISKGLIERSEFYVDDLSFDGEFIAEFPLQKSPARANEVNRGLCDSTRFLEQRFHLHLIGLARLLL